MRAIKTQSNRERRRHGRLQGPPIECSVGKIENISYGGMVVVARRFVGHPPEATLSNDRYTITVKISAVRSWGFFWRRYVAYRFVDPPADLFRRLFSVEVGSDTNRVI